MEQNKKVRLLRFIGIICWFLALFILMDGKKAKEEQAAEEAKQNAIVMEMEEKEQAGTGEENTMIFPSK